MVMPAQMQGAMHHQMDQHMRCPAAGGTRLPPDHAGRQDHVAGVEGEHVGGFVAAAMAGVQPLDHDVGGQDHGPDATGRGRGAGRQPFDARNHLAPCGAIAGLPR